VASELGAFLRARRGRVQPVDVGLPPGTGRRRTPGLRREELAALAGISIDYYVRLEQGRETNPSVSVLNALARALLLDRQAKAHLFELANRVAQRATCPPADDRTVRPSIRRLLQMVRPCPAFVMNRINDILDANPEGLALLAGIEDWPPERRNTIRYAFLHPAARTLYGDWASAAANGVSHLRTQLAAEPAGADPRLSALVDEMGAASPEFAALWARYDVRGWCGEQKTFHHPEVGRITLLSESLRLDYGQRVTLYQAEPGTPDHDALTLLSAAVAMRD
jgi:transcriptional regulator with XRE-family HTH domain